MRATALSVAISLAGCSTTATIHRVNGPAYEATILRSDPTSLEIQGDDARPYRVPREQVSDIDHPGNVLATVGAVLLGIAGLTSYAAATDNNGSNSRNTAIAVGIVYGLPGLLMAVAGGAVWLSSKDKARACEESLLPIGRMPPETPAYPPPWTTPPWPPAAAPATPGRKPPIRRDAEPMPAPPEAPPQPDPPSFRPAPPAPESAPETVAPS